MKLAAVILLVLIVFVVSVRLERPYSPKTPPGDRVLELDESNPDFVQVKDAWPPQPGTPLWLHPNRTSFGVVCDIDGDKVLIDWNTGDSSWIASRHLRNAWIPVHDVVTNRTLTEAAKPGKDE